MSLGHFRPYKKPSRNSPTWYTSRLNGHAAKDHVASCGIYISFLQSVCLWKSRTENFSEFTHSLLWLWGIITMFTVFSRHVQWSDWGEKNTLPNLGYIKDNYVVGSSKCPHLSMGPLLFLGSCHLFVQFSSRCSLAKIVHTTLSQTGRHLGLHPSSNITITIKM